jgi:hypothetical protein
MWGSQIFVADHRINLFGSNHEKRCKDSYYLRSNYKLFKPAGPKVLARKYQ